MSSAAHLGARFLATAAFVPLALIGLAAPPTLTATADPVVSDRTSSVEANRVDRVPTPVLRWTPCRETAECATAQLPLDYDDPRGATIDVALLRIPAKNPVLRQGSIFFNPGGPADSATDFVFDNAQGLPEAILDRFDIVGVDPRGVGASQQLRCFATEAERARAEAPLAAAPFPVTPAEQRSWIGAARTLGRACSATARQVSSAMSSTEDARDLDVLRRAVGDRTLTYLGVSFGSYLGQVYANLFPDRVRAIALDGIVDPQAMVGTPATADVPVFQRLRADTASYRALHELLLRCQRAGQPQCSFADGDTQARFDNLAARLRAHPLSLTAPGIPTTTYGYANLVFDTEQRLHDPAGYLDLFPGLTDLELLTTPGEHPDVVLRFLARRPSGPPSVPGYDNHRDAEEATLCTDGLHAEDATSWLADRGAPYFGAFYGWITAPCARDTWTARDEDAYRGPFDRRTAAPVLVVGGVWDPATSFDNAVAVARLLPNSRLIASDNWGHVSLTTSACVDEAEFGYLLDPLAPAPKITHCHGDVQPFAGPPPTR